MNAFLNASLAVAVLQSPVALNSLPRWTGPGTATRIKTSLPRVASVRTLSHADRRETLTLGYSPHSISSLWGQKTGSPQPVDCEEKEQHGVDNSHSWRSSGQPEALSHFRGCTAAP